MDRISISATRKCCRGTCPNKAVWFIGRMDMDQPTVLYYLCHAHFWEDNELLDTTVRATQALLKPDGDIPMVAETPEEEGQE